MNKKDFSEKKIENVTFNVSVAIGESVLFILMLIFAIELIGILGNTLIGAFIEILLIPAAQGVIVCFFLLIIWPGFIQILLLFVEKQMKKLGQVRFQNQIFDILKTQTQISISQIANDYHLDQDSVQDLISKNLEKGYLRGSFDRTGSEAFFKLASDFQIQTLSERKNALFEQNIQSYLRSYKWVPLSKIAKSFEISPEEVEHKLQKIDPSESGSWIY